MTYEERENAFFYQSKEKQAKYLIDHKGDGCPAFCKNCLITCGKNILGITHICASRLPLNEIRQNKVMIAKEYLREQKLERICK
jgi:hypothetical protein